MGSREINLTQGQVAIVDDDDYDRISQWNWYAWWNPHTQSFYAVRATTRANGVSKKTVGMHREVMGLKPGDRRVVDHIESGRTLDNRKSNLRVCTDIENRLNSRPHRDRKHGTLKGAHFRNGKWRARIGFMGKQIELGRFNTEQEANMAYANAANRIFGKFARP